MSPVWRDVAVAVSGAVTALLVFFGGRLTVRSAQRATRDERDAAWNALYRASAERHLGWDWMIVGRLQRLERQMGIDDPLPPPPPLFPPGPHPSKQQGDP